MTEEPIADASEYVTAKDGTRFDYVPNTKPSLFPALLSFLLGTPPLLVLITTLVVPYRFGSFVQSALNVYSHAAVHAGDSVRMLVLPVLNGATGFDFVLLPHWPHMLALATIPCGLWVYRAVRMRWQLWFAALILMLYLPISLCAALIAGIIAPHPGLLPQGVLAAVPFLLIMEGNALCWTVSALVSGRLWESKTELAQVAAWPFGTALRQFGMAAALSIFQVPAAGFIAVCGNAIWFGIQFVYEGIHDPDTHFARTGLALLAPFAGTALVIAGDALMRFLV